MIDAQLFDPANPNAAAGLTTLEAAMARAEAGTAARDAAIDQVEANAPDAWWAVAWSCVRAVAATYAEFTTDDVWEALTDRDAPPPPEPRAMGALMRRAKREGIATPTDRTRLSTRPACHRRPVRVWARL